MDSITVYLKLMSPNNHKGRTEQNLSLVLVNILLSSRIAFAYVWLQILVFLKSDYRSPGMTCNQCPPKPLLAEAGLSCPRQRLPFSAYWCPAKPRTGPSSPRVRSADGKAG